MKPKVDGQQIQISIIEAVYKTKLSSAVDTDGKKMKDMFGANIKEEERKFIKEHQLKVWFYKDDIRAYGEYTGSKKNKIKNRSLIYNRQTQSPYIVAHSMEELHNAINGKTKIGFK